MHETVAENPSLPKLVAGLGRDTAHLVQEEIALAKAEIRETVRQMLRGVAMVAAGGAIAMVAAIVLVEALVRGVTSLLALGLSVGVAVWLGPLLVAGAFGSIGALVIAQGRSLLERASLGPDETKETIEEAKEWLTSRAT